MSSIKKQFSQDIRPCRPSERS